MPNPPVAWPSKAVHTDMRWLPALKLACTALLAAQVPAALACGHCVEDKIAAVYDHAIVIAATAEKHQVVFFAIDGPAPSDAGTRAAIQRVITKSRGIDPGSARISFDSASLSIAFDPRRVRLSVIQRNLERGLAPHRLSLMLLRTMEKPAELKVAGAR